MTRIQRQIDGQVHEVGGRTSSCGAKLQSQLAGECRPVSGRDYYRQADTTRTTVINRMNAFDKLIVLALVSVMGCQEDANLIGTTWVLEQIETSGGAIRPPVGEEYTLRLLESDVANGQQVCNTCAGHYKLMSDDTIQIGLGCTEAGCGGITVPYIDYINGTFTFSLDGSALRLQSVDEDVHRLTFIADD